MERKVDTLVKSQETLAQVMTRIEMQLSQQANQLVKNKKELYQVNHCRTVGILGKRLKIQSSITWFVH